MKEPKNPHEAPNGGWRYTDSRTGIKFADNALNAIYQRVYKTWMANDIPVPENWKEVVADEICTQLPHCNCREAGVPERYMTLEDVARFGVTLKNWLASGGAFVPQEEADRRAAICRKCPENRPVGMCLGCSATLRWMAERVGWPSTKVDPELQSCAICSCLNRLKVHVPLGVIDNKGLEYPSFCWQNGG